MLDCAHQEAPHNGQMHPIARHGFQNTLFENGSGHLTQEVSMMKMLASMSWNAHGKQQVLSFHQAGQDSTQFEQQRDLESGALELMPCLSSQGHIFLNEPH